ncbi:MAG TPA: dihydroorotate dehydrogenase, partial [Negativicutes bacterium]
MSVVIVGADHLGGIEKNLYSLGIKELIHITG